MKKLALLISLLFSVQSIGSTNIGFSLSAEFTNIKAWIQLAEPDGIVGGLYPYVQMDGYKVMYSKEFDGEHETIRIFLAGENNESDFSVTYLLSKYFEKDKLILKRFIGPEPKGWRMDAINYKTQEYIGHQGASRPFINPKATKILEEFGITVF